jgi:glucokinase
MGIWAVGVDLGGTNVRAAEIDDLGGVGLVISEPVDHQGPELPAFGQLISVISRVIAHRPDPPAGIGLGITGPVDPHTGVIANPYTLPASYQGDVRSALEAHFALPIAVENDANVAVLAESRFGPAADRSVIVCVTVGTGIGVGVITGGRLHRGAGATHPEAGHLAIDPSGPACYCGVAGCLESLASGSALAEAGRQARIIGADGSAREVHRAAADGDPAAQAIVARARRALATGARNLAAVHAADAVVLTGNALGDVGELVVTVQSEVDLYPFAPEGGVMVIASTLAGHAGCLGAASLILSP